MNINSVIGIKPKTKDKPEFQNISDWLALAPVFDNDSISGTNLRTRKLIEKNSVDQSGNLNTRAWLRDGSYITPLPGSEEETKEIFNIFESNNKKAILKTRKYANEEYVKSGALKNFRFLHIATHGMVNEDKPELSCILLAQDTASTEDNILFSGEIYNLDLDADLTVLSACETGLGKIAEGEGVIGLTRALLYAGSKKCVNKRIFNHDNIDIFTYMMIYYLMLTVFFRYIIVDLNMNKTFMNSNRCKL